LIESADGLEWKKELPGESSVFRANSPYRDELTTLEGLNIKDVPSLRTDADDIARASRRRLAQLLRNRCSRCLHPMLAVPLSIVAISFEARSEIAPRMRFVTAFEEVDPQTGCQRRNARPEGY
jgi:hypothetical protein